MISNNSLLLLISNNTLLLLMNNNTLLLLMNNNTFAGPDEYFYTAGPGVKQQSAAPEE